MKIYFQKQTLNNKKEHNQFVRAILYALRFDKIIDKKLMEYLIKYKYKFNNICYEINSVLSKHDYFLKVFELKNKFRYLSMKEPKNKTLLYNYQVV